MGAEVDSMVVPKQKTVVILLVTVRTVSGKREGRGLLPSLWGFLREGAEGSRRNPPASSPPDLAEAMETIRYEQLTDHF